MTSYICLAASHAPQLFKTITALPLEHHQLSPCTRSSPTAPNMLLFFYHIELPAVAPSPLTTIPFLSTPFSNTPIKGLIFLFLSFLSSHSFEIKLIWLFPAPPHGWAHIRVTSDHIAKHGGPSSDFTASEITITAFSKPSPPSGTASRLDFPLILCFSPFPSLRYLPLIFPASTLFFPYHLSFPDKSHGLWGHGTRTLLSFVISLKNFSPRTGLAYNKITIFSA